MVTTSGPSAELRGVGVARDGCVVVVMDGAGAAVGLVLVADVGLLAGTVALAVGAAVAPVVGLVGVKESAGTGVVVFVLVGVDVAALVVGVPVGGIGEFVGQGIDVLAAVIVGVLDGVGDSDGTGVLVLVLVGTNVAVDEGVVVGVPDGGLGAFVAVGASRTGEVALAVGVAESGTPVAVFVLVDIAVQVGVLAGVAMEVTVGETVGVFVAVEVLVGIEVGDGEDGGGAGTAIALRSSSCQLPLAYNSWTWPSALT